MAKIKGVALVGIVKTLKALRATAEPKLSPANRRYLDERIVVSEWYPEDDYRDLVLTLGELIDAQVPGNVWEFLGEEGARAQFNDVYAMAVFKDDPIRTLQRSAATWSLYHDTGRVELSLNADSNRARLELHDYPVALPELCSTTTGYLRQLLVLSGASEPRVRMVACPAPGDGPVVWEAEWKAA